MKKILRVKKKSDWRGIELRIVLMEVPYLNSHKPVKVTRVVAPNDGIIPILHGHKETLKSKQEKTIKLLNGFMETKTFDEVKHELTRELNN